LSIEVTERFRKRKPTSNTGKLSVNRVLGKVNQKRIPNDEGRHLQSLRATGEKPFIPQFRWKVLIPGETPASAYWVGRGEALANKDLTRNRSIFPDIGHHPEAGIPRDRDFETTESISP